MRVLFFIHTSISSIVADSIVNEIPEGLQLIGNTYASDIFQFKRVGSINLMINTTTPDKT